MTMAFRALMGACAIAALTVGASAQTKLTIATVNNGDMVRMQGLTDDFTSKNPDIQLEWVTLEENVLRQNVTQDIATGGGQYDVVTIGTYEVPIWAKKDWLVALDDLPAEYEVDDLLPSIRAGLSSDGKLYAVPFYGESSFVNYRTDLAEAAGIKIPDRANLGRHQGGRGGDARPRQWRLRHLPARQARLGREHGLPDHDGQFLRRSLVRRELEAAVRQPRNGRRSSPTTSTC